MRKGQGSVYKWNISVVIIQELSSRSRLIEGIMWNKKPGKRC
jgi:hypothetical protein